ncbi:hypothetical protein WJX73_005088 [Symbiochloris irregularis]|uniref:Pre-mRNA-splicing factor SPF27 n=1 Tax=Symbiochloris irregularis TaxID=706552 RepID=A0AAW1P9E3_9CHLO
MALVVRDGKPAGPRPEDELIGLPYLDALSSEEQTAATDLVKEEASRSEKQPGDYLKAMTPMPKINFQGRAALQAEWQRVRANQPMDKLAFGKTMAPEPAQAQQNSVQAWRDALSNAQTQLEHQHNWLLNLELAQKYGPKAWQANVAGLDAAHKSLDKHVKDTDRMVEEINVRRALLQQSIATQLQEAEADWTVQVAKNRQIELANANLEKIVADAQAGAAQAAAA